MAAACRIDAIAGAAPRPERQPLHRHAAATRRFAQTCTARRRPAIDAARSFRYWRNGYVELRPEPGNGCGRLAFAAPEIGRSAILSSAAAVVTLKNRNPGGRDSLSTGYLRKALIFASGPNPTRPCLGVEVHFRTHSRRDVLAMSVSASDPKRSLWAISAAEAPGYRVE
jgi:hypothetical protein